MKNFKSNILLASLIAFTLFSCGNDDDGTVAKEPQIDVTNPNAVSEGLVFSNGTATFVTGAPPAPSTDPAAPALEPYDDENLVSISGSNLSLEFYETTGSAVKGIYFQVNDADGYYNIALSEANSGGRLFNGRKAKGSKMAKMQDHDLILVGLPDGLTPGIFCVTYCVYDDQNRVSNPIEVCIEVRSFGGANSGFLTANSWQLETLYYKDTYDGVTEEETQIVGETYTDTYSTTLYCADGTSQEAEVVDIERTNYVYVTFPSTGALAVESSHYYKYMDWETSTCESGVIYIEEAETISESGAWSYDDTSKNLTIVTEYEYEYEGETITETDVAIYTAVVENGKLKLSASDTNEWGSYTFVLTFAPKN